MLLGLYLAVTRVHRRRLLTLFGVEASVDWVRVLKSFTVWIALYGVSFSLCYLLFHRATCFNLIFGIGYHSRCLQ